MSELLLTTFAFSVEVTGVEVATFKEASGFETSHEVITYREATSDGKLRTRKLPGLPGVSDITLRRGISSSTALWEWRRQVEEGNLADARRDGSVVLYDATGEEKVRYNFAAAWPSKWKGPDVNAEGNEVAVEELVLACERLERA